MCKKTEDQLNKLLFLPAMEYQIIVMCYVEGNISWKMSTIDQVKQ